MVAIHACSRRWQVGAAGWVHAHAQATQQHAVEALRQESGEVAAMVAEQVGIAAESQPFTAALRSSPSQQPL